MLRHLIPVLLLFMSACHQPEAPALSGLVTHYSFSGSIADDSGNNQTKQIKNVSLAADRYGNLNAAAAFDGSSYVEIPAEKFKLDEFTYAAWVKCNYIPGGGGVLTIMNTGDYEGDHALVLANTTVKGWGMWSYATDIPNPNFAYSGDLTQSTNQWYHVAASRNKDILKIYVNGILSASQPMTGKPFYGSNVRTRIGQRFNDTIGFNGFIDEVRIYNRALDDSEIKQVYRMQ